MGEWLDISSAPRDGAEFLGYTKYGDCTVIFYDEPSADSPTHCWHKADGLAYHKDLFTHWMPLPDPPADK